MRLVTRHASAEWTGGFKDGHGHVSTESGALANYPYRYASRFEGLQGSNPEELIGAAHAACFTMALSRILQEAGFAADLLHTTADVGLDTNRGSFEISEIHLTLAARVPGMDADQLAKFAEQAKLNCPISKALRAITVSLTVIS